MQNIDCSHDSLPDACGNDMHEERLLERSRENFFSRERNLLIACVVLVVAMNISTGQYLLYPFTIFSTWVHECCHGFAAILSGGYISKLQIFRNGSGLAYTASRHRGFVASAGYPGTAVTGCILLLFRRTTLGPTIGTIGIGAVMLLTCALYVRDSFGAIVLPVEGIVLVLCGWKLPADILDNLYNFLAATCCLNAIENIHDLFASSQGYAGGQLMSSDAHTVSEIWGGDYRTWATLWLIMAIVLTGVGIVGARNAKPLPWLNHAPVPTEPSAPPAYQAHIV